MHPSSLQIRDYTYDLPDEKIARYPLAVRDQSRLLVYRNGYITEDTYRHIDRQLPEGSLLIFNQTKVIHARLLFRKPTGGRIEVFCLEPDERYADVQTAMLRKGEVYWKCLVGGAAKWKDGLELGLDTASWADDRAPLGMTAAIAERREGYFVLRLRWDAALSFAEALHIAGHVPLPPYLNRDAEHSDEQRYQTIFAHEEGSVAAPTAALHFTDHILQQLAARNIDTALLTLHVGAGTFRPVKSDTMEGHDMHAEWIEADEALLERLLLQLDRTRPVVAVGTTSARTLESLYWLGVRLLRGELASMEGVTVPQWYPYDQDSDLTADEALTALLDYMRSRQLRRIVTRTRIIIAPGYRFRIIDGLVTNFHQPQSTLLLLVAALTGADWRKIYDHALAHGFRFLSYGDGCLLWNRQAS